MIRRAFAMSVDAGQEAEYERRHRPIWPELEEVLRRHGVHTYSIFLHPGTRQLFAYVEFADEAAWEAIARTEVCHRWGRHMAPLMPSHPDGPHESTPLREVFHLGPQPRNDERP